MKLNDLNLHGPNARTEEVQNIIDRMPNKFGFWITIIVIFLFTLFFGFGWAIRYPDVVSGQIILNTNFSPLKLVSGSNGKLKLKDVKSLDFVKTGQVIAYIENPTHPNKVGLVDSLLKVSNPNSDEIINLLDKLPRNLSMGELNLKYYSFINSIQGLSNYRKGKLYEKRSKNLNMLIDEQMTNISTAQERITMAKKSLDYANKFFQRDSILFMKKVISEAEFDKTKMGYLSNKDALQSLISNLVNAKQTLQQTKNNLQELDVQNPEKEKELKIAVISSYNDLIDNIKSWEQKYVFKAPFNGQVQFLKFYKDNQFVQVGEQVFTIVPKQGRAYGQLILPAIGSGKIKPGQEVIVKLDNYPYMEYGTIEGRVKSISLTTNVTKTEKAEIETYMIYVDFPTQLKTNYGTKLAFKAESTGSADIITNDRRLIERLFGNLKYILKK